jgi:hypothetical protein
MAMTDFFFYEHIVREHFRELAARDRQLERWGWFRRHAHRPPETGWQFRAGEALIRLGCWLQGRGGVQPAHRPEEL